LSEMQALGLVFNLFSIGICSLSIEIWKIKRDSIIDLMHFFALVENINQCLVYCVRIDY
jgi:hypothetical protein